VPGQGKHLIIHERIGHWARQLRPRLADRSVRLVETRTWADLEDALRGPGIVFPIVVLDLGRRVKPALEDLDRARGLAPDALILVIDASNQPGLGLLARELGASHVFGGPIPPPVVSELIHRWLSLSERRAEASGWLGPAPPPSEPEPWNWLTPLLSPTP
jgi:hypothetical protein